MKKRNFITTLILGLVLLPLYASAQSATSSAVSSATEAQVFTACSQAAIEVRDESIGTARTAYNTAMSAALTSRKTAEKEAVAIADAGEKKEAIRVAVENYKKLVTNAQETLTKARKEAWATFESDTNSCRDISKESRKASTLEKAPESRGEQTEQKTEAEEFKSEAKSLRESIRDQLESIKNFFKRGE